MRDRWHLGSRRPRNFVDARNDCSKPHIRRARRLKTCKSRSPLTHGIYGSLLGCPGFSRGSFLVHLGLPAMALAEKLLSYRLCQYKSTCCPLYVAVRIDNLLNHILLHYGRGHRPNTVFTYPRSHPKHSSMSLFYQTVCDWKRWVRNNELGWKPPR